MIFINYGDKLTHNTREILEASDILQYLEKEMAVTLKPNLVVARPAEQGATTHPEIVEGVILFLKDVGVKNISVMEGSWVGDSTKSAFKKCGYDNLKKRYGVNLVDLKDDKAIKKNDLNICQSIMPPQTEFLINIPVLKAHCQTLLTCCLKNLKGCIPDAEKRRFHAMGLHKPIAALNKIIPTGYCVVDSICGDLTYEEGGNPVQSNRIIAGRNPWAIDAYCATLIGYKPEEIGYLEGAVCTEEIRELNVEQKPKISTKGNPVSRQYVGLVEEKSACSACYASLMFALQRLKNPKQIGKIYIGQGFRGVSGKGVGIGNCTSQFERYIKGCPPKALDIVAQLKN